MTRPVLVFAAALGAFLPALGNGFVSWDDPINLLANPHFRGLRWENLRWMFGELHFGMYQPLPWLTFALDYLLWGMRPAGYHLTSLLIHALNAVLFFLVARRLHEAAGEKDAGTLDLSALFAALLFGLHPLRTESVAWATERRDLVSGAFCLLTALAYLREARRRAGFPWAAWTCAVLALLSKGIAISLPFLLLILDLYPLRRLPPDPRGWSKPGARRALLEKLAFLAPAALVAAVGWMGQTQAGEIPRYASQSLSTRLLQAGYSLAFYLWKTVLPFGLSPLYPRPEAVTLEDPRFASGLIAAAALTALAWTLRRRWPAVLAAWAAYAVTLAPVSGLISFGPQLVADRYAYLSCLGPAALAGAGFAALCRRRDLRAPALAAAAAAFALLGSLSWAQAKAWRDDESLWTQALLADSGNPLAWNFRGNARAKRESDAEAEAHYREALRLKPRYAAAHNNLATLLSKTGRSEESLPHYAEAARLYPGRPSLHHNWGAALLRLGRTREAAAQFEAELRVNPRDHEALVLLERLKKGPRP